MSEKEQGRKRERERERCSGEGREDQWIRGDLVTRKKRPELSKQMLDHFSLESVTNVCALPLSFFLLVHLSFTHSFSSSDSASLSVSVEWLTVAFYSRFRWVSMTKCICCHLVHSCVLVLSYLHQSVKQWSWNHLTSASEWVNAHWSVSFRMPLQSVASESTHCVWARVLLLLLLL